MYALLRQISMMHIFSIVFYFFTSLPFMQNYWYFNEKCLMIGRKIAKGDLTCHNKPNFCFVRTNVIKMVMQSVVCSFEAKNNICSLTNFFLFTENLLPRNVWYWGMYIREIIFIVVSMICWLTSNMVQAVQNPCKMLPTLTVNNDIIVNMSHHIMISAG